MGDFIQPLAILAFILCCLGVIFLPPVLTLVLAVTAAFLAFLAVKRSNYSLDYGSSNLLLRAGAEDFSAKASSSLYGLFELQEVDDGFSPLLFLDFARILYRELLSSRFLGDAKVDEKLQPFLSESLDGNLSLGQSRAGENSELKELSIAPLSLLSSGASCEEVSIDLEISSTFCSTQEQGSGHARFRRERLRFVKSPKTPSFDLSNMRRLGTKSHWCIKEIELLEEKGRSEFEEDFISALSSESPEKDFSAAQGFAERERRFLDDNPDFSLSKFKSYVEGRYLEISQTWAQNDLSSVRSYMTRSAYQGRDFYLQILKRHGLKQVLEDVEVEDVTPIDYRHDPHYFYISVWIRVKAKDYLQDSDDRVINGSKESVTSLDEYWTFVRRRDVGALGAKELHCPLCGEKVGNVLPRFCKQCADSFLDLEFDWTVASFSLQD